MIKKIICDIEDVKDFQKFHYSGDVYVKLPLMKHEVEINPVPWDLRTTVDYKMNCYRFKTATSGVYSYIKTGTEVTIYPTDVLDKIVAEIGNKENELTFKTSEDVAMKRAYIQALKIIDKYREGDAE